jgi:hypothetical protein
VSNVTGESVTRVTEVSRGRVHDSFVGEREEVNQMATKKVTPKAPQAKGSKGRKPAATRVTKATKTVKAIKNVRSVQNVQ